MPVKARAGGQGRVRGGRPGAQQGTGGTPGSPTADPSFGTAAGAATVSGVGGTGSGGTTSTEVTQFFNRLITLPSTTRQTQYSTMIDGLVSDGVWSSLDVLCVAGVDVATSMTNLVQAPFDASYSTNPVDFTVDRGFVGDASNSKWIETNFNPTTASGNFVQDSALAGVWNLGTDAHNWNLIMNNAGIELFPAYDGSLIVSMINSQFEDASLSNTSYNGFFVISRNSSSSYDAYRNGTLIGSPSRGSVAMVSGAVRVATAVAPASNWITSAWVIGGGLNSTKALALYSRVQVYLQAIGAV